MNLSPTRRLIPILLCAAALVSLAACSNNRRIQVGETTEDELNSAQQLPVSLAEFSDLAVQDILQELPTMPELSEGERPVTILLGDINNRTGIVSTTDYEYVASRIRSSLIRANATRGTLRFVTPRARTERLASQERVASQPAPGDAQGEEIAWSGGQYYVPDYDASVTYGMLMDVYRIGRGGTNLYYLEVQIVSFATNTIVHSFRTETKQVLD